MFWIFAGLMALAAIGLLLRTLTAPAPAGRETVRAEVALCQAQLAEVERDVAAGLMTQEDAAEARSGIERRLLHAAEGGADPAPAATPAVAARRRMAAVIVVLLTPAAALGLYLKLGRPDLAGPAATQAAAAGETAPQLNELARRLDARLKEAPQDARGWSVLGSVHMEQGRYGQAAEAYRRAIALQPGTASLHSGLGEALTLSAQGQVTSAALEAFRQAQALDNANPAARYYLGLADYQRGRLHAALEAWSALVRETPPGVAWRGELQNRVEALARELGVDPNSVLPGAAAQSRQGASETE